MLKETSSSFFLITFLLLIEKISCIPREWINMTIDKSSKTLDLKTKNIRFSILAASQQCRRSIVRIFVLNSLS